jgi:hypothetical protein
MTIRHASALLAAGFGLVEVKPAPADGIRDDIYVEDENGDASRPAILLPLKNLLSSATNLSYDILPYRGGLLDGG